MRLARLARYALVPAAFATLAAFASGDALAKLAKGGDANVSFTATGPGGLKIVGTTSDLQVADGDKIVVTVPLKNLDTKIELRNKHMREKYLEVDKYPDAVLTVARSEVKVPQSGEVSSEASGTMKVHGKEKNVRFKYTAKRNGDKIGVTGSVRLDIDDYGIEKPSFMGATVKRDVDVNVSFVVSDT